MRDNRQEMILLTPRVLEEDRKSGVKEEVDEKKGWSPARGSGDGIECSRRSLLLCLIFPLGCGSVNSS